jgi:hypothetical protein
MRAECMYDQEKYSKRFLLCLQAPFHSQSLVVCPVQDQICTFLLIRLISVGTSKMLPKSAESRDFSEKVIIVEAVKHQSTLKQELSLVLRIVAKVAERLC